MIIAVTVLAVLALLSAVLIVPGVAEGARQLGLGLGIIGVGGALMFGAAAAIAYGGRLVGRLLRDPLRRLGSRVRQAARAVLDGLVAMIAPIGRALVRTGRAAAAIVAAIGHAAGIVLGAIGRSIGALLTRIGRVLAAVLSAVGHPLRRVLSSVGRRLSHGFQLIAAVVSRIVTSIGRRIGQALSSVGRALARTLGRALRAVGAVVGGARRRLARMLGATARRCAPFLDGVAHRIDRGLAALGRTAHRCRSVIVGSVRRVEHAVGVAIVKARLQTRADDATAVLAEARAAAGDRPATPAAVPFRAPSIRTSSCSATPPRCTRS